MVRRWLWVFPVVALVAGCIGSNPQADEGAPPPFRDALGTADEVCVNVDEIVRDLRGLGPVVDIRSGQFVAGNFLNVVGNWSAFDNGKVKMYWVPIEPDLASSTNLQITVRSLDGSGQASEATFEFPGGPGAASAASGDYTFWATEPAFATPGRYRVTAQAADHWGCFEFSA